jgi:hypothetical protein
MTYVHRPYPLFEWCVTFMMVGIALCVFLTPKTIEMGAFRFMIGVGFTPMLTFLFFTACGVLRVIALYANGRWPRGWIARCLGCVGGMILWSQMMVALVFLTATTQTLSLGIPVYLVLTIGEFVSCYRVAYDAHLRHQETKAGNAHNAGYLVSR